jgi:hypothetical protein
MLVGDHERFAIGGEADKNRIISGGELRDFAASREIDDGDGVRAGVGHVGDGPGRIEID